MGSIFERQWRGGASAERIIPDVIEEWIPYIRDGGIKVIIGTDAQKHGRVVNFVTGVVIHDPYRLRKIYTCRTQEKFAMEISHKLVTEAMLSLEVAIRVAEVFRHYHDQDDEGFVAPIEVHIDANPKQNARGGFAFDSGPYAESLAEMITSSGFKARLKPHAWAASHLGDHFVKNKHLPSQQKKAIRKSTRTKRVTKRKKK